MNNCNTKVSSKVEEILIVHKSEELRKPPERTLGSQDQSY